MNKREFAAWTLDNGFARRLLASTGAGSKGVRILAYHRVLDDAPTSFAFDEDLISASAEAFRVQMQFVRSHFDVVSFKDLYECEKEGRGWPDRALIVTFDDGYRDNLFNAFPVLKELGLNATIFLTTGYIGRAELFWWDELSYCVKHTDRDRVVLPGMLAEPLPLASPQDRRQAIHAILDALKRVPDSARRALIEEVSTELMSNLPSGLGVGMHLSWQEVREMARCGIEFGSHTVNHPILANVSPEQLQVEIAASKAEIERQLGGECLVFAYPAGRKDRFNAAVRDAVADCGYHYAVSYEEGLAKEACSDRYALPRIHVERDHSLSLFKANLMFPQWMIRSQSVHLGPAEAKPLKHESAAVKRVEVGR